RGFAHIGVLRALDEAGIPVDAIGGTSMGAFVGAQRAWGMDWRAMRDFNARCWNELKPLNDYTLPMVSLLAGTSFLREMKRFFGDARIEDLPLDYFCVSSNLTRGEAVTHARGRLWFWMCASMCIPGVAPPLVDEGSLYVDGGVLDNVPLDAMRARHQGP